METSLPVGRSSVRPISCRFKRIFQLPYTLLLFLIVGCYSLAQAQPDLVIGTPTPIPACAGGPLSITYTPTNIPTSNRYCYIRLLVPINGVNYRYIDIPSSTTVSPAMVTLPTDLTTNAGYRASVVIAIPRSFTIYSGPSQPFTINAIPGAPAVSDVSYCLNAVAAPLSATGVSGAELRWYASDGTLLTGPPRPSTSTLGTQRYYVNQRIGDCEGPRASITVTINPLPLAPSVVSLVNVCQYSPPTALSAIGAGTLYWYTDLNKPPTTVAPVISTSAAGTTYYYVSQQINGCEGPKATIAVTVKEAPPAPTVSANPVTYCQNASTALLSATAVSSATLLWYTAPTGGPGSTVAPFPSTASAGTINYYVSQTLNGCEGPRATITVITNEKPQPPKIVTQAGHSYPGGVTDVTVSNFSEPVILVISGCEGGSITWSGGSSTTLAVGTNFSNTTIITYFATCTRNGCQSQTGSATVRIAPSSLQLIAPTYDCQTGALTFRTQGGNNTPIEFFAIGVTGWTTNRNQFVDAQLRTSADAGPLTLYARQNGQQVSYSFDLRAQCAASANQAPQFHGPLTSQTVVQGGSFSYSLPSGAFTDPEGQQLTLSASGYPAGLSLNGNILSGVPTQSGNFTVVFKATDPQGLSTQGTLTLVVQATAGSALQLLAPDYNCQSGAFTFNTSGGDGTPIEFSAIGITGWTTNTNQFVDEGLRTATDIQPLTLYARQSGKQVSLSFDIRARCSGSSRQAAVEPVESKIQVSVLGNPVTGKAAEIEIRGVEGQAVELELTDLQGRALHHQSIGQAGLVERVSVPIMGQQRMLLLQVSTTTQRMQIKLLKQ